MARDGWDWSIACNNKVERNECNFIYFFRKVTLWQLETQMQEKDGVKENYTESEDYFQKLLWNW